jgi:hypothetical protein
MPLRRIKRRVLLEMNRPTNFGKTDLIYVISKKLKLKNYFELCTASTGNRYAEIDRSRFRSARRLMYNCPANFDDGLPIDHKVVGFDIADAVKQLTINSTKFDICLLDGWHTYDCAMRDLTCAYELLADGGVLVVHDCLPTAESTSSPTWIPGEWNGLTYRSFLDFVLGRDDLDYLTVDIDYGCGVIFKNRAIEFDRPSPAFEEPTLLADWVAVRNNDRTAFRFFRQNHKNLLRLISAKTFVREFSRQSVTRLPRMANVASPAEHRGQEMGYR